jgi:hypothetical protein
VIECVGPDNLTYRVGLPPPLHRMHNVFHVSSLRVYHSEGTYQPPAIPPVDDGVPSRGTIFLTHVLMELGVSIVCTGLGVVKHGRMRAFCMEVSPLSLRFGILKMLRFQPMATLFPLNFLLVSSEASNPFKMGGERCEAFT